MNNFTRRVIKKEPEKVVRGILLDLVQMDKKNEDRIMILYHKQ